MPWLVALALAAPPAPDPLPAAEEARRDAVTRYGLGRMTAADDRPASAAKEYEAAARQDPESPEPLRPLVRIYADLGRDPAAIRTARRVLELDPADADTAHALGQLLFDAKKPADAAKALKQAADSPRLADRPAKRLAVLRDLARAASAASDFPAAEAALRSASSLVKDRRSALLKSPTFPAAADLDREAATIQERLGDALAGQRKFRDAATAYALAAAAFADPAGANDRAAAARLHRNLAATLADAGEPTAGLDHLRKFLALGPVGVAPWEQFAALLRRAGRSDGDVRLELSQYAQKFPGIPAIHWLQLLEMGKANPADAHRMFRGLAATTADPEFYRVLARHYRETNRPGPLLELADDLYRAARPPSDANGDPAPGKSADPAAVERARNFTAAVRADPELVKQVLRFAGDGGLTGDRPPDTWELVAGLAERERRLDLAERALRAARSAGGDRAVTLRLLEVLSKMRRWRAVERECEVATPPSAAWVAYRARALAEQGRADAIEVAAPLRTLGHWGRLEQVRVLNTLGRHREAVAEAEELLRDFPAAAEARKTRLVLADALNGLKNHPRAEAELRTLLDADPDDVLVLNNLGYNLADQGRKLAEAEEMVRRAIVLDRDRRLRAGDPDAESGVYLDSLGWVLFRRGKLADARDALEKAAALPDAASDAVVWDHLGDVAFKQGDRDRASAAWAEAARLFDNSHQGRDGDRLKEVERKRKMIP